eukprot:CAMPEP_0170466908 /NCGR_PEP_ID=MMETSP0123-20130129/10688_1 /TAXON_ID=182087 /ORGANISM="Favella ehrenbergii, Strain Fehren 1" /LENGTH=126 /DNA_ID=CAMNT_0010733147 /DNA_START=293 /DNA_END=674 /DNA_ORIENTATION=-
MRLAGVKVKDAVAGTAAGAAVEVYGKVKGAFTPAVCAPRAARAFLARGSAITTLKKGKALDRAAFRAFGEELEAHGAQASREGASRTARAAQAGAEAEAEAEAFETAEVDTSKVISSALRSAPLSP